MESLSQQILLGSNMWLAIAKVVIAAILISFVSWLSGRKTGMAGFLTALPLTTLLALAFGVRSFDWSQSL
jgi:hypothetical protein